jgi:hypothetical protein
MFMQGIDQTHHQPPSPRAASVVLSSDTCSCSHS